MSVFVVVRGVLIAFCELSCKLGSALINNCHYSFKGTGSYREVCFYKMLYLLYKFTLIKYCKKVATLPKNYTTEVFLKLLYWRKTYHNFSCQLNN